MKYWPLAHTMMAFVWSLMSNRFMSVICDINASCHLLYLLRSSNLLSTSKRYLITRSPMSLFINGHHHYHLYSHILLKLKMDHLFFKWYQDAHCLLSLIRPLLPSVFTHVRPTSIGNRS